MAVVESESGMTETDLDGRQRIKPGKYHVLVQDVSDSEDGTFVTVDFAILAGPEAGRDHQERFYLQGKDETKTKSCKARLLRLAYALGLIEKADVERGVSVDTDNFAQRNCIINLVNRDYVKSDGSKGQATNCEFLGFWRSNDPTIKDVMKDSSFVATTQTTTAKANGSKAAPAKAQADDDEYGDV